MKLLRVLLEGRLGGHELRAGLLMVAAHHARCCGKLRKAAESSQIMFFSIMVLFYDVNS